MTVLLFLVLSWPVRLNAGYIDIRQTAIKTNKPLIVWISTSDLGHQMPEYLHYTTSLSIWYDFKGPLVLVSVPKDGELYLVAELSPSEATPNHIAEVIQKSNSPPTHISPVQTYSPPIQTYIPMMSSPMMNSMMSSPMMNCGLRG